MTIVDVRTFKTIDELEIPKDFEGDKLSSNDLAAKLVQFLNKYKDKNIGIGFSEL